MIDREELKKDLLYLIMLDGRIGDNFVAIWGYSKGLSSISEIVDSMSEKDIKQVRLQVNNTRAELKLKMEKDMNL